MKLRIAKLSDHLNDNVRLVACVHDELVLEVKEELAEECKVVLQDAMISAAETVLKTVPAQADASIGDSWAAK